MFELTALGRHCLKPLQHWLKWFEAHWSWWWWWWGLDHVYIVPWSICCLLRSKMTVSFKISRQHGTEDCDWLIAPCRTPDEIFHCSPQPDWETSIIFNSYIVLMLRKFNPYFLSPLLTLQMYVLAQRLKWQPLLHHHDVIRVPSDWASVTNWRCETVYIYIITVLKYIFMHLYKT